MIPSPWAVSMSSINSSGVPEVNTGKKGPTITTGRRKEIGDLVSEGRVIGMFRDGHELDDVVPKFLDSGENICGEFGIGAHSILRSGYAD